MLTLDSVRKVFLDVIEEKKSFGEASRWASEMIEKDERGLLEFDPKEDISTIFSGLTYLLGVDLEESPGVYFHSIQNVKDEYNELFY